MRTILLFLMTAVSLGAYDFNLTPKKVSSGVYCFFGEPEAMNMTNNGNMVNTCYLNTSKGYVVIDSGSSYAYAQSAYKAMQKIKPLSVALVINTHVHDDHWLGNGFFAQMGVKVFNNLEEGIKGCDVVIMLRLQNERMNGALLPSSQEYFKGFGLTPQKLALAKNIQ